MHRGWFQYSWDLYWSCLQVNMKTAVSNALTSPGFCWKLAHYGFYMYNRNNVYVCEFSQLNLSSNMQSTLIEFCYFSNYSGSIPMRKNQFSSELRELFRWCRRSNALFNLDNDKFCSITLLLLLMTYYKNRGIIYLPTYGAKLNKHKVKTLFLRPCSVFNNVLNFQGFPSIFKFYQ